MHQRKTKSTISVCTEDADVVDLKRTCIHEAGHFYLALKYREVRAVSIRISGQIQTDALTGEEYVSVGQAVTFDPHHSKPRVQVCIRAAGLAAESLVYNESFDDLMRNPAVRFRIKTDTDNAKRDLEKAGLPTSREGEFMLLWKMGFDDAVMMMVISQDKLLCIAGYCLANLDREIPKSEVVANCRL